jgi:hypothetical protein
VKNLKLFVVDGQPQQRDNAVIKFWYGALKGREQG